MSAREPIAIVSVACRFPGGADDPEAFWDLLRAGRDAIGPIPPERWDNERLYSPERDREGTTYVREGGFLRQPLDTFDAALFGIAPHEAKALDPQQRLLLEVSWELFERAGIGIERLSGSATGVFVGIAGSDYQHRALYGGGLARIGPYDVTGTIASTAAGRLAYVYDLRGPALAVDTACSSSLVALDLAVASLRDGRCDAALAGGVNVLLAPQGQVCFSRMNALSASGRCRAFSADADGFVRAEGCGLVLLKRLSDARAAGDPILALVRATAVNQDGRSNGLTAPNPAAQEALLREALAGAGLRGAEIDYLEAHGTGTPLGDPIELEAAGAVLCAGRERPLIVGAVKSAIGHAEAAAGIAGLIKIVLALRHGAIPPNLHAERLSPHVPWAELRLELPTVLQPWRADGTRPRRAGVSAFGFGGTNAHAILEEAPPQAAEPETFRSDRVPVLCVSARDPGALETLLVAYRTRLCEEQIEPAALAAAAGRRSLLPERAAAVLDGRGALDDPAAIRRGSVPARPRLAFAFTGQGAQHAAMGRTLYAAEAEFRAAFDACAAALDPLLGTPLGPLVFEGDPRLDRTGFAQPALFALEVALARLLLARGCEPVAFVGHSVGDLAAAHLAGVLPLDEAARLVATRARLMDALPAGGGMIALACDAGAAQGLLAAEPRLCVAALNGPRNTVVAGPLEALDLLAQAAAARGIEARRLAVSHAFHSPAMAPVLAPLRALAQTLAFAPARIPLVVEGDGALASPEFWVAHVRRPVDFEAAVRRLVDEHRVDAVIEVGPHPVLCGFGRAVAPGIDWLPSLRRGRDERTSLAVLAAECFVRGLAPPPPADGPPLEAARLPAYPFQRRRHWLEDPMPDPARTNGAHPQPAHAVVAAAEDVLAGLHAIVADATGATTIDPRANLLDLGVDSLMLMTTRQQILARFGVDVALGQFFEELTTLDALARYVAARRPVAQAESPVAPAAAPAPPRPAAALPLEGAASGGVEALMARQLEVMAELMHRQLDALRGSAPVAQTLAPSRPDFPPPAPVATAATPVLEAPLPEPFVAYKRIALEDRPLDGGAQQAHLAELIARFDSAALPSKEETQRYRAWFANNRNVAGFRPAWKEMIYQIVAESAEGAYFDALGGRRYLDVTMGFGVHLFGHKPPFVQAALRAQLERGLPLGPMHRLAGEIARDVAELTGVERVAFCNSGTEAVMLALRVARTATNRTKIALFESAYHGSFDGVLALRRRDGSTVPGSPGTPAGMVDDVLVLRYGDPESLEIVRREGPQLAAVLVEPIQSRQLHIRPVAFLHELRRLTQASGTALIFDEVVSGFRHHLGGCQALFGIAADLVTYGKVIGGGMPIGLVAGKAAFVDAVDGGMWRYGDDSMPRKQNTFVAGTFTHHPLTLAAMRATIDHLKSAGPALQEELNARTERLCAGLNADLEAGEVPIRVVSFGSLFRFYLPPELELLFFHLIERGIYVWEGRNCFLSTAHGDAELERIREAVLDSVAELRRGGYLPPRGGGSRPAGGTATVPASPAASKPCAPGTAATTFSLFFFGSATQGESYDMLLDAARFADAHGFEAVWTPERHFDPFGALYPNPCVTAAALATATERIRLRAGSTVILLHDPIRFAENWAMVDRLSKGRVDLALALGWNANDFVLAPDAFADRAAALPERLAEVRALWRGETRVRRDGAGNDVAVEIHPKPVQREIPIWITAAGNPETFAVAGRQGANVLTYLEGQSVDELAAKIATYREARRSAGHAGDGRVTLMLHTYVGEDEAQAAAAIAAPLREYLRSSLFLRTRLLRSLGRAVDEGADIEPLLDRAVERYVERASLIGSPAHCIATVTRLRACGVDEIACLIDFGLDRDTTMAGLARLRAVKDACAHPAADAPATQPMTPAQRALWFLCRESASRDRAYSEAAALRWNGSLDPAALRAAYEDVVERHPALRFRAPDGERQTIGSAADLTLVVRDVEPADVETTVAAELDEPFDLTAGALVRLVAVNASDRHVLLFVGHHLIVDGWSIGVVLRELAAAYGARLRGDSPALPPAVPFSAYVAWRAGRSAERARALAFWEAQLAGSRAAVLPTDHSRAGAASDAARIRVAIDGGELQGLRRAARAYDATLVALLVAGWRVVLDALLPGEPLAIALPVAGQSSMGETHLVGPCSAVLPAVFPVDRTQTAEGFVRDVRAGLARLYQHHDLEPSELAPGALPPLTVLFNHDRVPALPRFGDAPSELVPLDPPAAKFELALNVVELPGKLVVELEYRRALFEPATAQAWLTAWREAVGGLADDPARPVGAALASPVVVPALRAEAVAHARSAAPPQPADDDGPAARMIALWREVLRVPDLGPDDDFFAASGQSLQALQLLNGVRTRFGTELPIAELFALRTPRLMAARLNGAAAPPPIPRLPDDASPAVLSAAQTRMWLMQQAAPHTTVNAIAVAARIDGPLDAERLRRAFTRLVERHEYLRTRYEEGGDGPRQRIGPPAFDWSESERSDDPDAATVAAAQLLGAEPFDLAAGPVVRVALLRFGAERHGFALAIHHIASDGASLATMLGELARLYRGDELAEPAIRYRDYAAWSVARADADEAARAFWAARLRPLPPQLALSTDFPRGDGAARPAASTSLLVPAEELAALRALARTLGTTPFVATTAVSLVLLQRLTGLRDLAVAIPVSGRTHPQLAATQGLFVNTAIVRAQVAGEMPFSDLVAALRDEVVAVLAHGDYPFDRLVDEVGAGGLGAYPITPVMVAFHDERALPTVWDELRWTPLVVPVAESPFELLFQFVEDDAGLTLRLEYRSDLFRPARVRLWLDRFATLLAGALARPDAAIGELSWQPAGAPLPAPDLGVRLRL